MKRLLCIVLTLIMCLSLISCGEKPVEETTPTVPDITEEPITETETEEEQIPVFSEIIADGCFDPEYDYSANARYKVCYIRLRDTANEIFDKYLAHWCGKMNIEYTSVVLTSFDDDLYISKIETLIPQYDGFILEGHYSEIDIRCNELLDEAGCSYVSGLVSFYDNNGLKPILTYPCVSYHTEDFGTKAAEYLVDYYRENWSDVPVSKIGVMRFTINGNEYIENNEETFLKAIYEAAPELRDNVIDATFLHYDESGGSYSISQILEEKTQYSHWLCYGCFTGLADSICTALTDHGFADTSVVVGYGMSDTLFESWDSGAAMPERAAFTSSELLGAEHTVSALYAFMTGMSTPETIWSDWIDENDAGYGKRALPFYWITKENYRQFAEWIDLYAGANFYSYDVQGITAETYSARTTLPDTYKRETPNFETFTIDDCEVISIDHQLGYNSVFRYRSIRDVSFTSPTVIIGKVVSVRYTDSVIEYERYYAPYTIYDIEITDSVRGGLAVGSVVSVTEYGGYLTAAAYNHNLSQKIVNDGLERYSDGCVVEWGYMGGIPPLKESDEVLLFLRQSEIDPNAFEVLGSWMGMYHIEDGTVWRYIEADEIFTFGTVEEAKKEIENFPFDIEVYRKRFGYDD